MARASRSRPTRLSARRQATSASGCACCGRPFSMCSAYSTVSPIWRSATARSRPRHSTLAGAAVWRWAWAGSRSRQRPRFDGGSDAVQQREQALGSRGVGGRGLLPRLDGCRVDARHRIAAADPGQREQRYQTGHGRLRACVRSQLRGEQRQPGDRRHRPLDRQQRPCGARRHACELRLDRQLEERLREHVGDQEAFGGARCAPCRIQQLAADRRIGVFEHGTEGRSSRLGIPAVLRIQQGIGGRRIRLAIAGRHPVSRGRAHQERLLERRQWARACQRRRARDRRQDRRVGTGQNPFRKRPFRKRQERDMDRGWFGNSLQRWRSRLIGDRGRQLEECLVGGLAGLAHEVEPEPGTAGVVLDQTAEDRGFGPELGAAGRTQRIRQPTGGLVVAQQQGHLGGTARELGVGGWRRQVIDERLGGVQVAHGDQPLDARREHAAGLGRAGGGTGHEQPPRQVAQRRHERDNRQIRQQPHHQIRVGTLPERPIEPALGRPAEPEGIQLRRRQPFDCELSVWLRRYRLCAGCAPWLGWGGKLLLGRGFRRDGVPRSGKSRMGPCCASPAGAVTMTATAIRPAVPSPYATRRNDDRITRDQRGNWSSGSTRSTRAVGGGISQVMRNTVPPSAMTRSSTTRTRLIVDMICQRYPSCCRPRACLAPGSPLYIAMREALSTSGQSTAVPIA